MTTKAETKTAKPPVTRRLILCTQSTGRVGKSTVAEGLISWLRSPAFHSLPLTETTNTRLFSVVIQTKLILTLQPGLSILCPDGRALPPTPVIILDLPA